MLLLLTVCVAGGVAALVYVQVLEEKQASAAPAEEGLQVEMQRALSGEQPQPSLSSLSAVAEATRQPGDIAAAMQTLWSSLESGDEATVIRGLALVDALYSHGSDEAKAAIAAKRAELALQQRRDAHSAEHADEPSAAQGMQQASADFAELRSSLEQQLRIAQQHMQQQHEQRLSDVLGSLTWMQESEAALRALVDDQQSDDARRRAQAAVMQDDVSCAYFHCLQLTLVDVMTGCKAAHSGWVSQGHSNKKDWVIKGLGLVMDNLPVPGAGVLKAALQYSNDLPKMHAVNAMAAFCVRHSDWQTFVERLALLLVAVRRQRIADAHDEWKQAQRPSMLNKAKGGVKGAVRFVMADDVDSPMKQLADDDARRLCWAVMKGRIRPTTLPMDVQAAHNARTLHELLQAAVREVMREEKEPYAPRSYEESSAGVADCATSAAHPLVTTAAPGAPRSSSDAGTAGVGSAASSMSSQSASVEVVALRQRVQALERLVMEQHAQLQLHATRAQWQERNVAALAKALHLQLEPPPSDRVSVQATVHFINGKDTAAQVSQSHAILHSAPGKRPP